MPLIFAPAAAPLYNFSYHARPRWCPQVNPRDKYLEALAAARSAEEEYVDYLRIQQAEAALAQEEFARQQLMNSLGYGYGPRAAHLYSRGFGRIPCGASIRRSASEHVPLCHQREQSHRPCPLRRRPHVLRRRQQIHEKRDQLRSIIEAILGARGNMQTQSQSRTAPFGAADGQALSSEEVEKLGQAFQTLFGDLNTTGIKQDNGSQSQRPEAPLGPNEKTATPHTSSTSLKQDLEARLGNEVEVEIRDTIHAILASLCHPQPPDDAQKSADLSTSSAEGKGKGKEVPILVSDPAQRDIKISLDAIHGAEASFHRLESEFTMPKELDFTPPSALDDTATVESSFSRLSFTSINAPIHNYTHALSQLLIQLDAVESFGSNEVRTRRKEVIGMIERALENVDSVVEHKSRLSRPPSVVIQPEASDLNVDEPSAGDGSALKFRDRTTAQLDAATITDADPIVQDDSTSPPPVAIDMEDTHSASHLAPTATETTDNRLTGTSSNIIDSQKSTPMGVADGSINPALDAVSIIPPNSTAAAPTYTLEVNLYVASEIQDEQAAVTHATDNSALTLAPAVDPSSRTPLDSRGEAIPMNTQDDIPPPPWAKAEQGPPEVMDTFLFPASSGGSSPSTPVKEPMDEELVVVEDGSDGDAWSEVEERL